MLAFFRFLKQIDSILEHIIAIKMKEINLVHVQVNLTKRQNRPQFRQIRAVMKAKFKSVILTLYNISQLNI